ncbi:MAG: serine hydrolase domain-containing protein [Cyanobium sp.]
MSTAPPTAAIAAPAGWSRSQRGALTLLQPPEGDSRLVILQIAAAEAAGAEQAVARFWRELGRPAPALQGETPLPDALGWVKRHSVFYAPSGSGRSLTLIHQRSERFWSLVLLDLSVAVDDRRGVAVQQILESVQAPGFVYKSFAGRRAAPLEGERRQLLSEFVAKAQRQLQVPGVAVGILQNDRLVLAEGHGERRLGEGVRPDADTLFMVGSTTKPLTSLLLARLVDQGRLAWDTPVRQVLPELRLGDPDLTAALQVKHLLCACSGVPRRDLLWLLSAPGGTPETTLRSLALLRPTSALGELFQYNNQMVAAAGFLAGRLAHPSLELGAAYDRAMQELLFEPLGMTSSTLSFERALAQSNLAWPHGFDGRDRLSAVAMDLNRTVLPQRPAGGVWSSVNDMLRYVALELRGGRLADGRPLLSAEVLRQRWQPQVDAGPDVSYGLALLIDRSLGTPVLLHTGATFGYKSLLFWLPEHNIGAVVLSNGDQGDALMMLVRRRLLELLFDGRPQAQAELEQQSAALPAARAQARRGLRLSADPQAASPLASHYTSPELGGLTVRRQGEELLFGFGWFTTPVASRQAEGGGGVEFVTTAAGFSGFVFERGDDGRSLSVREGQHCYRFSAEHRGGSGNE